MGAGFCFILARDQRDDLIRFHEVRRVQIPSEPFMPFNIDSEPTKWIDATFAVIPEAVK